MPDFLLRIVFTIVLCIAIPILFVNISPAPAVASSWVVAFAIVSLSGMQLTSILVKAEPALYTSVFWTFVYVFMGLAPLLQIRFGRTPETTPYVPTAYFEPALHIVLLGLVAASIGISLSNIRPRRVASASKSLSASKTLILTWGTFLFTGVTVAQIGLAPYFESRLSLGLARANAWSETAVIAILLGASLALPLTSLHALVHLRRQQFRAKRQPGLLLTTAAMFVVLVSTVNLISSPRITFGTMLLSLAVLFGAARTRNRMRGTVCGLLVMLLLVFPMADAYRFGDGAIEAPDVHTFVSSGDYDAFAQIANTVMYVDRFGTTGGKQALGVVLFWIPRSIWDGKPEDTGVLLAESRGYGFANLSAPLWAEAYINWGWIGVVITFCFLGYWLRRLDHTLAEAVDLGGPLGIAGAILPFYMLIVLRGSLLQAMGTGLVLTLTIWFVGDRGEVRRRKRDGGSVGYTPAQ